ncbi:MAG: T9SS type A sorting domain-containing protein [Bacteroidetes bacterium]|nr:T9SS type A sorting domain-containing protein [Bacteroidota bacterium]
MIKIRANQTIHCIQKFNTSNVADDMVTHQSIYTLDGRLLQTNTITGTKAQAIDVSKLPAGMYIIKAMQLDQVVHNGRFVKE